MRGYSQQRAARIVQLWIDIQDIIGLQNEWPYRIVDLFWTRNVQFFERQILTAFVYVNGLNPELFMEWVDLFGLARDHEARNHFLWLFSAFDENPHRWTLYGWNITMRQYQYIDGRPRQYIHHSERNLENN